MNVRRAAIAAAVAAALTACGSSGATTTTTPSDQPPDTVIYEDDARWDCRTMGNRICGSTIWFDLGGELQGYDLDDPTRPACFVEPSNTPEGFEVIFYYRMNDRSIDQGFEVNCP